MWLKVFFIFRLVFAVAKENGHAARQAPTWKCLGPVPYKSVGSRPSFARVISDQPPNFVPYKILPFYDENLSPKNLAQLQRAFQYVQDMLAKIVRAPPLSNIRFDRILDVNNTGKCLPVCDIDLKVPSDLVPPCPADQSISDKPSEKIIQLNKEDYTLVLLVVVKGDGHDKNKDYSCIPGEIAKGGQCQEEPRYGRPSHGSVRFCTSPDKMNDELLFDSALHETLHVLLPNLYGETRDTIVCDNEQADNCVHLLKEIPYTVNLPGQPPKNWFRYLATHALIKKAAQEHFGCEDAEGADLNVYDPETDDEEAVPDFGHWSERLFPDELMSSIATPRARLSNLTLSALAAFDSWYRIDFSHARPLHISKPSPELACDVVKKTCHDILDEQQPTKPVQSPKRIAPYCEPGIGPNRIITSHCTEDYKRRLHCMGHGFCPVLNSIDFDDIECEKAVDQNQPPWTVSFGGQVGKDTICVTFTRIPFDSADITEAACVLHECRPQTRTIVLKPQPKNLKDECFVECPAEKSNQLMNFTKPPACIGTTNYFTLICPNYTVLCGSAIATPAASSSAASTSTASSSVGVRTSTISKSAVKTSTVSKSAVKTSTVSRSTVKSSISRSPVKTSTVSTRNIPLPHSKSTVPPVITTAPPQHSFSTTAGNDASTIEPPLLLYFLLPYISSNLA